MRETIAVWVWLLLLGGAGLCLVGCDSSRSSAAHDDLLRADMAYHPSVEQGFHFNPREPQSCGFLTAFSVAGEALQADLSVTDPFNPAATQSVVGVLGVVYWQGGIGDPIHFLAYLSPENQQRLRAANQGLNSRTPITFALAVYDYDIRAKTYYRSFHTNDQVLTGTLLTQGGQSTLTVDETPHGAVTSPVNYAMTVGIVPPAYPQEIHAAFGVTKLLTKMWGISVAD